MMKKALLSLLLVAVFMPFAMAQTNPPAIVNVNAAACETYLWDINGVTYTNSTVDTCLT